MRRICVVLVLLGLLIPSGALARRAASRTERATILAAVVHQKQLSKAQAACQVVTISTVSQSYAKLAWPSKLSAACAKVAANGVIIEHRRASGWAFLIAGSLFTCPLKAV